jgi:hypothetical protein
MKNSLLLLGLLLLVPAMSAGQCEYACGDADTSGQVNAGDASYIMDYLYNGGPLPMDIDIECANFDNYPTLTISDVWWIVKYVFSEGWPPDPCPPVGAPMSPVPDTSSALYYTDYIPAGAESGVIALTFQKNLDEIFLGLSLPLRIRVDGQIPIIDSVVITIDYWMGSTIYEETGEVAIGFVPFLEGWGWEVRQIAHVYVTIPPQPTEHTVTLEWTRLTPLQAPTPDSSLIPMYMNYYDSAVIPRLEPHCCLVPGDANMDGTTDVGDAVYIINCIFMIDCFGHPCENQIDANCDGTWNVGDAVFLINYIFASGAEPCCI